MRFKIILIVLIYGLLPSYLEAQVQLSADCEVSVLTIGPGQALNDAFGHSAIRIRDAGQNIDLVFDPTTSKNEPQFVIENDQKRIQNMIEF